MELFVVNRAETEQNQNDENEEQAMLDKVLKKIERNKKIRTKQKEKEHKRKAAKLKTIESRQIKRDLKAKIVPVPENKDDDFIDKSVEGFKEDTKVGELDQPSVSKSLNVDPKQLGFTILGADNVASKSKVKRVLPNWLANPTVISMNLQNLETKVSDVKLLDKGLRKLLKANGIQYFFPVQATVIPHLLETLRTNDFLFPMDICVSAPTGSGKTLAFVLPVIQALKRHTLKKIRALVILPTQDLALQVYKTFKNYAQNTDLDVCLITGNHPFKVEQTQLLYKNKCFGYVSKVDILVCTAGRLVDHLKLTEGLDLQYLEYLVIDEADRVLDNVQNDWLYHLEKHMSQGENPPYSGRILNLLTLQKRRPPQKLLFSATLTQDPEKLQKLSLFQPKLFTTVVEGNEGNAKGADEQQTGTFVGKFTTPKELKEKYIVTTLELKPLCLYKFIEVEDISRCIVFTHSAESAHRLAILLRALFKKKRKIEDISSNLPGKNRPQLIEKFSRGEIDVLVCTDALARGIDLPNVQCVVSYSAPKYLKTYIHRAGRTARAGEEGLAVTMLTKPQIGKFTSMLRQADKTNVEELTIPEEDLEFLGEQYKDSLKELKKIVDKEEKMELDKTLSAKKGKRRKRKRNNSGTSAEKDKYSLTELKKMEVDKEGAMKLENTLTAKKGKHKKRKRNNSDSSVKK
ncbi:unnamed protein product [Callosobruchus maculatus]|uniref:ATP-dependent RNA helicase n=1 Tax=Callosobruchus maculatus TaxID=64391 RepID=A0A653CRG9_CALMS|nr:unnamed protein product [Callosobruchus maculatus]